MLLVACPLTAAVAQTPRCDTLPAFQREFARTSGACRDLAPIIDIAPPVEAAPSPTPPVPKDTTEAVQTTVSPVSPQAKKLTPKRSEPRKSRSKPTAASAKSGARSKPATSRKSEGARRNEPLDAARDRKSPSVVTNAPAVNETREPPNVIGKSYPDAANSTSAASVAPASQLEPATAPAQNDRVAGAFISGIASTVVTALVAGVLVGLLLGAVLMRRALLTRSRAIGTAPAERADIEPAKTDNSQAAAQLNGVAAIEPPPKIKFTAWLEPGEATIEFADLLEEEEAAIEYSRNQYAE